MLLTFSEEGRAPAVALLHTPPAHHARRPEFYRTITCLLPLANEESEFIYVDDIDINPLPNSKLHAQRRGHVMRKITLAPRLVRVNVNDKPSENVPIIHHTVLKRFEQVSDYRPITLRNKKFKVVDVNGNIGEPKLGIAGMR